MEKALWFFYGFLTAMAIILLGIVGWGTTILMRVISLAPIGLIVVVSFVIVFSAFYWIVKPSEKKQINS